MCWPQGAYGKLVSKTWGRNAEEHREDQWTGRLSKLQQANRHARLWNQESHLRLELLWETTLSRLFAQLETKSVNPDLSECEFTLGADGDSITEKNFSRCSLSVRVFNSDFVRANLHFDGGSFNPILLLGKESEEAQRRIDELSKRIKRSEEIQRKLDGKFEELKARIAQAKTDTAKFIRQRLKVDPYTATHLAQDLVAVGILDVKLLAEKELADAIELALTPDSKKPSTVDELHATPSIEDLHKEAIAVLAATPSFSNTIKHLDDNITDCP